MAFKIFKQRATEAGFLPALGDGDRTQERRIAKDLHGTRPDEFVPSSMTTNSGLALSEVDVGSSLACSNAMIRA